LALKPKSQNLEKGRHEMMKKLLTIAAALALISAVALAQEGPAAGTAEGPDTAAAQAGPAGGPMGPGPMTFRAGPGGGRMQGRSSGFFTMRVRGPMGAGPMMRFRGRGMGEWWNNAELAQRIGLSDQQKAQLQKVSLDSRLKMIDLRADLEKQQVILGPMLQTYHPDEAAVIAQVEKVSQARAAVEKARVQTMLASRNVLTQDQWNKLKNGRMEYHRSFARRGFQRPMRPRTPATPQSK
jgi:Spy/CpxP family protein refolding chaperone